MKIFAWLIAVSLAANAVLAGYWLQSRRSNVPATSDALPITDEPSRSRYRKPADTVDTGTPTASDANAAATWEDIQTKDLKDLIGRLRAVGCPEETIKDMIVAEVNRRYAVRSRELWPDRYKQVNEFWRAEKRDLAEQKKNRELWRKDRELQREKSALLVELLGVDPERELRREEGYDEPMDWNERQISFLPESKREAVAKYLEEFNERSQEMSERNRGIWDAQARAEQKQLEAEKLAGLAQFLTPAELREYELRQSQTATQLSHDLRTLSLTREQYEAIFDIRKKYGDSIYNYSDTADSKDARQRAEDSKKAMKDEMIASLGTDFAKQYERSQDYNYQQLTRLTKKHDLPGETAGRVYDYKTAAEESAKQLRENKDLTAEARQAALQQVRTETEAALRQALGDKIYNSYLKNGGWWINNLAPAPPKNAPVVKGFQ